MKNRSNFDIVVAGAGPGGFAAALGAARHGRRVLLLDQNSGPGGVAAYAGCPVFQGVNSPEPDRFPGILGELIGELRKLDAARMSDGRLTTTEAELILAMHRMLRRDGVTVLFYATLCGVQTRVREIESARVFCAGEMLDFSAEYFIDATGDAVLAKLAGAEVIEGTPEESMTRTLLFTLIGVESFDKASLVERFASKNFPFPHQDRFMGVRLGADGPVLLNLTAVAGNSLDPWDLTTMDIELREQIAEIIPWLQREFKEFSRCRLASVAPKLGVRVSRNIVARNTIQCHDLDENTPVPDPVAFGPRSYGEHYVKSFDSPWRKILPGWRGIPYGALLPVSFDNLAAAGRCIGAETRAVSAIRSIPCCLATGYSAGIAAANRFPEYDRLAPFLTLNQLQGELQA